MDQDCYKKPVKCNKKILAIIDLPLEKVYAHFTEPELFKEWYGFIGCWISNIFEKGFKFYFMQDYAAQIVYISKEDNKIKLSQKIEGTKFAPADILISFQNFNKMTKIVIEISAYMPGWWFEIFNAWAGIAEIGK